MKKCLVCGAEVKGNNPENKEGYCSIECKERWERHIAGKAETDL